MRSASISSATAARPASATADRCRNRSRKAVHENDLVVCSVLSGNRNFEGRINPHVKANYLASPPLVVAYASPARPTSTSRPSRLGQDKDGNDVYLNDIWPSQKEIADTIATVDDARDVLRSSTARRPTGPEEWQAIQAPTATFTNGTTDSTYVQEPPFFVDMPVEPPARSARIQRGPLPRRLSAIRQRPITSARPGRSRPTRRREGICKHHGVAPRRLQQLRQPTRQRPRDDSRHVRQHPPAKSARSRHRRRRDEFISRPANRRRSTTRAEVSEEATRRWSCWPARSTAPVPRATGPPRGRTCSASGPSSPKATNASTAAISSAWACCRCSSVTAKAARRWNSTAPRRSTSP